MADPSHPDPHQFRQTFSQFGPPVPYQSDQNASQFQGTINPGGPPKILGMTAVVPPPLAGQQFIAAPNNYMSMQSQPHGHVSSLQNLNNGPQPPTVAGNINGFVAPIGAPVAGVRPPGLAPSLLAGQSQAGSFPHPVPGSLVTIPPPASITTAAVPPQRMTLNGSAGTPLLARTPSATSGRFPPPPPISQDGHAPGPPRPPMAPAYPPAPSMQGPPRPPLVAAYPLPHSMQGQPRPPLTAAYPSTPIVQVPPRFTMTEPRPPAPVSAGGSGPPSLSSASRTSGSSTPVSGPMSSPNELPIPFHGQAQYSHQIGAASKLTPNPTPSNSEPPSQRSSRGPSPVNEQSYDALEGQFIPGPAATVPGSQPSAQAGIPGASLPPATAGAAPPLPGLLTGAQVLYPPQQGQTMPLPAGQRMPPPLRPGMQGAFSGQIPPPPRPGMQAPPMGQVPPPPRPGMQAPPVGQVPPPPRPGMQAPPMGHVPPPPTVSAAPFGQPVGQRYPQQAQIPGPRLPPPSDPLTFYQSGPPSQQPGPNGPPSAPYSLGPPVPPSSHSPQGGYFQPPLAQQGTIGPPSGPTGVPSGPFSQPVQPSQGYPGPITGQNAINSMAGDFNKLGVSDSSRVMNLMQEKKLIPSEGVETTRPNVQHDHKKVNCNPEVFRCTLNAIPQTSALLNKARLPLGILIHPFKDLSQLPVIQSSVIVRCRSCRTYINPYVTFVDQRRWKCNLCFRINELPDEFSFDPVTKTYGDPQRRPEIRSATIEFIAPSEYMLRPPQPAVYLFVLDVSFNAIETGYLRVFTQTLLEDLDRLPGDARTQIGFLCFDSALYFFNLSEGLSQPQMLVVPDIEDVFLPCPDSLLVNLHECRDMVVELLNQLPNLFDNNHETGNALGTALQAAFKLVTQTGGRVTVMQTMLPTVGPGSLENREATSQASSLNSSNLGPASDFYKKLALDCSAQQVAVDLFMLNGQYADIATISCISKYSAGCVQYYPSFHTVKNPSVVDKFESDLRRYITRKIGFESVMRIRCTRGVSIHTFHGNFFVRSTDLLSLPNVNPDAGFGMQMSIEENLTESSNVCFQAALLYTSSKGERRIRVHSLCVPITNQLSEVFAGADQQAIAALLAKMAVDRTISSSLEDARDAMINACQDMMNAFATQIPSSQRVGALMAPHSLRLMPLFTLSMLKSMAFRLSANIKVDDRVFAHLLAKTLPTGLMLQNFYPHLYPVHALNDEDVIENNGEKTPKAPLLQLSSANIDRHGVYIMDQGDNMYMLVGAAVSDTFCKEVFDVPNFAAIHDGMTDLPDLENVTSERLRCFISHLIDSRPGGVSFCVIREDSKMRYRFFHHMVEDRTENSMSYYEFLQFIQQKIKG